MCLDKIRISNYNIKTLLEDNKINCFDNAVYDTNRAMSCIGNISKPNTDEVLPPFKPYDNNKDISKLEDDYRNKNIHKVKRMHGSNVVSPGTEKTLLL